MRAHLSHEAAPPWLDIDDKLNMWAFFVELTVGTADLEAAAADWNRQAAAFPQSREGPAWSKKPSGKGLLPAPSQFVAVTSPISKDCSSRRR
jgi:hypothetical protein